MLDEDRDGDYGRIKAAFVPLRTVQIRDVTVSVGQLREGEKIVPYMSLLVERLDYPAGAQFIHLRLSTVRRIAAQVVQWGWDVARRLTDSERAFLDKRWRRRG